MLKHAAKNLLNAIGLGVFSLRNGQMIPEELPEAELYVRADDHARYYRPWLSGEWQERFHEGVTRHTMLSAQKLYYLWSLCEQSLPLEGDVFEAGAGSGGSARMMLDCLRQHGVRKTLWLLDTFEGYQKVDAQKDGSHVAVDQCKCDSESEVAGRLENDSVPVRLIKGLIPETLKQVEADAICFAHIDVNLYEPTKASMDFCLERMPRGAAMVFDDYNWPATFGARKAIDEVAAKHGQRAVSVPESTQAFLIKV